MNRKVTVVGGAGNVGATVARGVADKQLADVIVIDIADQKAAGIALDMLEACPVWGSDSRVMGTGDYAASADSDIVVASGKAYMHALNKLIDRVAPSLSDRGFPLPVLSDRVTLALFRRRVLVR